MSRVIACFVLLSAIFIIIPSGESHIVRSALSKITGRRAHVWHPEPGHFEAWLNDGEGVPDVLTGENVWKLRNRILNRAKASASRFVSEPTNIQANDYPYFAWIPDYIASVIPGGPAVSFSAPCFSSTSVQLVKLDSQTYTLNVNTANSTGLLCSDLYLFATISGAMFEDIMTGGAHSYTWTMANGTLPSEAWDMDTKGIRVMRFLQGIAPTLEDVLATITLFGPELTKPVSDSAAAVNLDFMTKYAGVTMLPRTTQEIILDPSQIQSGDFLGIIRLDGLDPMLAWAMGSTTGHTTVALWIENELNVCESTTTDSYWPTNGIQCTPYLTWMAQAKAADYQVVHAPLSADARARFNVSAAIEFFNQNKGLDYGYHTMLWAWIDTVQDNYPCLPPDFKVCLVWDHIEVLFGLIDKLVPAIGDLLFSEAWNKRLGTTGLRAADLYYTAAQKNIPANQIPTIVEQDSWLYNMTRDGQPAVGKNMVCCVFVCNIWKAGGLFDDIGRDNINCAEMTNWDDYSMMLFDTQTPRPAVCQSADPNNQLCQIEGKYTLSLNNFSSKKPYAHMAETCPAYPPKYERTPGC